MVYGDDDAVVRSEGDNGPSLTPTSPIVVAATGASIGVIGSPVVFDSKRTKMRNVSRIFSFVSL
ncbi:PAB-dependent poly(A)-specific ribonuclease subunit 2-like protein [Corchorus olitorius]|uniref:PAB-dependent poly(A)-specific ribonuclease subunit 2-like protein n=1 Tax=Corchorus olitorius TaxID=93759 RepID=A0A1R3KD77_9ROSI|nr:PAB-dependent poly(A)-specific ribonuclease subunit 2-like protein [Corchorus olitorius]